MFLFLKLKKKKGFVFITLFLIEVVCGERLIAWIFDGYWKPHYKTTKKYIFFSFRIACKLKITLFGHKFLCPQEQFDFHKSKN